MEEFSGRVQPISHINSPLSLTLSVSPSPLLRSVSAPLQQHTTRDVEQGIKGVFSGPVRGPLPLLGDLSPNLEYMFVHRRACTKCWP